MLIIAGRISGDVIPGGSKARQYLRLAICPFGVHIASQPPLLQSAIFVGGINDRLCKMHSSGGEPSRSLISSLKSVVALPSLWGDLTTFVGIWCGKMVMLCL